jgi:hypothetical protein
LKKLVDSKSLFDKKILKETFILNLGHDADAFQKISVLYDIINNLNLEEKKIKIILKNS